MNAQIARMFNSSAQNVRLPVTNGDRFALFKDDKLLMRKSMLTRWAWQQIFNYTPRESGGAVAWTRLESVD